MKWVSAQDLSSPTQAQRERERETWKFGEIWGLNLVGAFVYLIRNVSRYIIIHGIVYAIRIWYCYTKMALVLFWKNTEGNYGKRISQDIFFSFLPENYYLSPQWITGVILDRSISTRVYFLEVWDVIWRGPRGSVATLK